MTEVNKNTHKHKNKQIHDTRICGLLSKTLKLIDLCLRPSLATFKPQCCVSI